MCRVPALAAIIAVGAILGFLLFDWLPSKRGEETTAEIPTVTDLAVEQWSKPLAEGKAVRFEAMPGSRGAQKSPVVVQGLGPLRKKAADKVLKRLDQESADLRKKLQSLSLQTPQTDQEVADWMKQEALTERELQARLAARDALQSGDYWVFALGDRRPSVPSSHLSFMVAKVDAIDGKPVHCVFALSFAKYETLRAAEEKLRFAEQWGSDRTIAEFNALPLGERQKRAEAFQSAQDQIHALSKDTTIESSERALRINRLYREICPSGIRIDPATYMMFRR